MTRMSGEVMEVAVVLDDRIEALDQDGHAQDWREWLRISNALNFRQQQPTVISALTNVVVGAESQTADTAGAVAGLTLPAEWAEPFDLTMSKLERELIAKLALIEGLPVPVLGHETDDGIPIDVAWPDQRVAVCFDASDGPELERAGWRVLPPDVQIIASALTGAA